MFVSPPQWFVFGVGGNFEAVSGYIKNLKGTHNGFYKCGLPLPAFLKPPLNTGSYPAVNGRPDRIQWHRSVQSVTFLQVTDRTYPSQPGVANFLTGRALRRAGLVRKCSWDPESAPQDSSPEVLTTRQRFPWRSSKSSLPTLFVTDAVTSDLLLILHHVLITRPKVVHFCMYTKTRQGWVIRTK